MKKNLALLISCLSLLFLLVSCNSAKKEDISSQTNNNNQAIKDDSNNINNEAETSDEQNKADENKEAVSNNTNSIQSSKSAQKEHDSNDKQNNSQKVTKVSRKIDLYEGSYLDDRYLAHNISKLKSYCNVVISNITTTSFDFTVYEIDRETENKKVIFLKNTAIFIGDGTKAAFYGKDYTLNFTFPSKADIKVSGFKPLEGNTYINNSISGLKLYEGTYWDERCLGDNNLNLKNNCEVAISNVTNTSFDFTVYEVDSETENRKVIFLKNTAVFAPDGSKATFYGKSYTLSFTFPSLKEIRISGFKPLEGNTYLNNKIPGHECS